MKIKKILILMLCVVFTSLCLFGCKEKESDSEYAKYFNDYESRGAYASAEVALVLPDGVTVSSYDRLDDVYVIEKKYSFGESEVVRYGFCSDSEVYITPIYSTVVDIRGDYAIVVKSSVSGISVANRIGLVKFRGENKGREYGFSYSYASLIIQYSFLSDKYLAVLGSATYTDDDLNESYTGTYRYATIYDYTSAGGEDILELGRIANITNESRFTLQDTVLAVSDTDVFYFYDTNKIASGGFELLKKYVPFSTDDGYVKEYVDTDAYYVGNNWFVLTAYYTVPDNAPEYYEMVVEDEEKDVTYYLTIRTIRYNPMTDTTFSCDRVVLVANEYNKRYISDITDSANIDDFYYAEEGSRDFVHYYATPVIPAYGIIKEGYSLAYYYYPILTADGVTGSYSFCVLDEYCNIINLGDLLFPLVTVDGIGVQSPDPNFDMPFSDAVVFTLKPELITLQEKETDEKDNDLSAFYLTSPNNGMVLSYRYDTMKFVTMMGAYDLEKKALTVPYEYAELSVFVGGYALGTKYEVTDAEKGTYKIEYYRVDKNGESLLLEDCVAMKNGVYMTKSADAYLYGLKANDGKVLLENKYEAVSVVESFLSGGKYFESAVFAVEKNPDTGENRGVIFKLS